MPFITVGRENSQDIKIHFEDHGAGDPIVLIHGYPFSGAAWEKQEEKFLKAGHRVITYDRRGFGLSSRPAVGYEYETFTKDLDMLLSKLDLHDVTLVGHSMGTGEMVRYLCNFQHARVKRAIFVAPIAPFLLKTADNKAGVDKSVFDGIKEAITKDRYAFMAEFLKNFYNTDETLGKSISDEKLRADFTLGSSASAIGFYQCVDAWLTDFRKDLPEIKVPCLVIQGDADRILPLEATGKLLAQALDARLVVIPGGSHGIPWTHADVISKEVLSFMSEGMKEAPRRRDQGEATTQLH